MAKLLTSAKVCFSYTQSLLSFYFLVSINKLVSFDFFSGKRFVKPLNVTEEMGADRV
jgi:hypothetical protein